MAENRYLNSKVLDKGLEYLRDNGNKEIGCSDKPTTYLQATDTFLLMEKVIGSGDYTIADGVPDGRRITVGMQTNVPVAHSGTATHFCIVDTVNEEILLVTPCIHFSVTEGETENINEFSWTNRAPTAPE